MQQYTIENYWKCFNSIWKKILLLLTTKIVDFCAKFSLETYLVTLSLSVSYTNIWTPWHTKRLRPQQRKEENRPENRIETIFASFLAYGNKVWKIWSASEKKIGRIGCHESHSKSVEKDQRSSHHWEFVIWGSSISRHFLYFHLFFNAWNGSKKVYKLLKLTRTWKNFPIFF